MDRATFPRDKTCGDGLTTGALRWLEHFDVPLADLRASARVEHAVLVAPSGHRVELPLPSDGEHARVMRRVDLDAVLLARTRDAGVEVVEARALTELRSHEAGVDATLDDGTVVQASFAIAADGQYSTARRLLSPEDPPVRGEWSAFRQYFRGVDDLRLWVLFERSSPSRLRMGVPAPRRTRQRGARRSCAGRASPARSWPATWRTLLASPVLRDILGPRGEPESPHRAWPIPSHLDPERLVHGRVLFVGDAAGVVDPMTGEGIAQALETGALAATAAVSGATPDAVADTYRAVRRAWPRP